MEEIEYRAIFKFLTKQGMSVLALKTQGLQVALFFKQVRESLEDDPQPGWPVEVTTSELVEKVEKLILEDARLKKKQLVEMVGVSDTTIFLILNHHFVMTKISTRWVVLSSRAFFNLSNKDSYRILSRIMNLSQRKTRCSGIKKALTTKEV